MSKYLGHLVTSSMVTITTDKEVLSVPSDHLSYSQIVQYLKDGEYTWAIHAADATRQINKFGQGQVVVKDGVIYYNNQPLHNSLTTRIIRMVKEGYNVKPMLKFLENLMVNPSSRAVSELYRFLESNNLPITEDGYFLAYKNVREDYYDKHSGTFRNMIGDVCQMPRNKVMDDPNQTCSAGLHFCSIEYLNSMWGHGGRTMVVKINPADVVSIPVDYNNSKGRCCQYEVIAEHDSGSQDTLCDQSVYGSDPGDNVDYNVGYEVGWDDALNGELQSIEELEEIDYDYSEGYKDGHNDCLFYMEDVT